MVAVPTTLEPPGELKPVPVSGVPSVNEYAMVFVLSTVPVSVVPPLAMVTLGVVFFVQLYVTLRVPVGAVLTVEGSIVPSAIAVNDVAVNLQTADTVAVTWTVVLPEAKASEEPETIAAKTAALANELRIFKWCSRCLMKVRQSYKAARRSREVVSKGNYTVTQLSWTSQQLLALQAPDLQ